MTGHDLTQWREHLGFNRTEAARRLDITRVTLRAYEEGKRPVPGSIALACAAIALQIPPWPVGYDQLSGNRPATALK